MKPMTVANLVNITPSQSRDARKLRRELGEGVLNLLADARTEDICLNPNSTLWVKRLNQPFEIVGNMSPSQTETALGAGMKATAIIWDPLNPRGQSAHVNPVWCLGGSGHRSRQKR